MIRLHFSLLTIAALVAVSLSSTAWAQYVWIDEKGVRQYSDMPPPLSVPNARIIKQPNVPPAEPSASAPKSAMQSPTREMTLAEKNAEFRKRQAERVEKEREAAEEAKRTAEKASNCERVRDHERTLASGQRIMRTNKNGERTFLSNEQRERELREARRMLDTCE